MILKNKSIILWLCTCIVLIYAIIIVGGYTRLTHSGLSIVQWKPISGIVPPLSNDSWQTEFEEYQQSPEYQKINHGMQLEEFKQIFLVEYLHRLLGRIIGLAFLLPFLYFSFAKCFTKKEIYYYSMIAGLIGLQGAIGWFMVKSGLIDNPNVSQYRLALHLIMACIILGLLVWKIIPGKNIGSKYAYISLILLFLQIISGAFVAGLHAGLVYNSFPLMDGQLIPDGLFIIKPWYLNIFENITMVQFIHRSLGIVNVINILAYCYKISNLGGLKKIAVLLSSFIIIQLFLGILTLILQVPLPLALLHQTMAIALLITMIASLKGYKE